MTCAGAGTTPIEASRNTGPLLVFCKDTVPTVLGRLPNLDATRDACRVNPAEGVHLRMLCEVLCTVRDNTNCRRRWGDLGLSPHTEPPRYEHFSQNSQRWVTGSFMCMRMSHFCVQSGVRLFRGSFWPSFAREGQKVHFGSSSSQSLTF